MFGKSCIVFRWGIFSTHEGREEVTMLRFETTVPSKRQFARVMIAAVTGLMLIVGSLQAQDELYFESL